MRKAFACAELVRFSGGVELDAGTRIKEVRLDLLAFVMGIN
jgi:hypothetical protein